MAQVRFEHVTHRFGDTVALDNFTLGVEEGEFLVVEALGSDNYVTTANGLRARLPDGLVASTGDHLTVSCRRDRLH